MSDVLTQFGRRQDTLRTLYTETTATTEPPNRPLGNISLIGNILIDLHHRKALSLPPQANAPTLDAFEDEWAAVRDLAQWEWSLIEGPLREKIEAAKAAQS